MNTVWYGVFHIFISLFLNISEAVERDNKKRKSLHALTKIIKKKNMDSERKVDANVCQTHDDEQSGKAKWI
jgi:hypothetical protein